jgi:hypothetical protein
MIHFALIIACLLWTSSAIAQSVNWVPVPDVSQGDNLTNGPLITAPCLWDGSNCDRWRGDVSAGAYVQLRGGSADNSINIGNKVPVLPCVAASTSATNTYTNGNNIPINCGLTGNVYISQGNYPGTGTAQWGSFLTQAFTLFNSQTTGAANTAVTVTIPASAAVRAHLNSLEAQCSAGSATITVQDGATTIWTSMGANVPAAPATYRRDWNTPLTGSTNTTMTITLSACGVGNTGTLHVQAGRF